MTLHPRYASPRRLVQQLVIFFAIVSGVMSAIFNIGYTLALPIADTGVALGQSRFGATNCIWLLMLGAGSIPNLLDFDVAYAFCGRDQISARAQNAEDKGDS